MAATSCHIAKVAATDTLVYKQSTATYKKRAFTTAEQKIPNTYLSTLKKEKNLKDSPIFATFINISTSIALLSIIKGTRVAKPSGKRLQLIEIRLGKTPVIMATFTPTFHAK